MVLSLGQWFYIIIITLLLIFALIGNALVIYCVVKFRKLRSVTNALICNLAVSDILLAAFVMPQRLHHISHEDIFSQGEALCKISNFSLLFFITSSAYTLVCISFERHRAIIEYQRNQITFSVFFKILPVLWIFSFLVSFPTLIEYGVVIIPTDAVNNTTGTTLCCGSHHVNDSYSLINTVFVVTVSYLIPVILMTKNYSRIAYYVWQKSRRIQAVMNPGEVTNANIRAFRERIRVVKLLVWVAVIFAVTWLPFYILLLYAKISGADESTDASGFVNLFLLGLVSFSTVYNTVLYVIFNPSFIRAMKVLFTCKCKQRNHQTVTYIGSAARKNR